MSRYSLRITLLVSLLLLMAGPGMAMHLGPPADTNDDGTGDLNGEQDVLVTHPLQTQGHW